MEKIGIIETFEATTYFMFFFIYLFRDHFYFRKQQKRFVCILINKKMIDTSHRQWARSSRAYYTYTYSIVATERGDVITRLIYILTPTPTAFHLQC